MKRVLTVIFLTLAVSAARAENLPLADAFYGIQYANSFSGLYTNTVVVGTNNIGDALYHTFYINTSTNTTSGASYAIAFSGDTTNWVTAVTLSTASTGATALTTNFVSKQMYYRVSVGGTNVAATVSYLGGR